MLKLGLVCFQLSMSAETHEVVVRDASSRGEVERQRRSCFANVTRHRGFQARES